MFCPLSLLEAFVSIAIATSLSLSHALTLIIFTLFLSLSLQVSFSVRMDQSSLGDAKPTGSCSVTCPLRPALHRETDSTGRKTKIKNHPDNKKKKYESKREKLTFEGRIWFLPWGFKVLNSTFHSLFCCLGMFMSHKCLPGWYSVKTSAGERKCTQLSLNEGTRLLLLGSLRVT